MSIHRPGELREPGLAPGPARREVGARPALPSGGLGPAALGRLMGAAGNKAVAALVQRRLAEGTERAGGAGARGPAPRPPPPAPDRWMGRAPATVVPPPGSGLTVQRDGDEECGITRSGTDIRLRPPSTRSVRGTTPQEVQASLTSAMTTVGGHVEVDAGYEGCFDRAGKVNKATVDVAMRKFAFTWGAGQDQATPAHAAVINRYFGLINAHEDRHIERNRKAFKNAHAKLLGKTQARAEAAWDRVRCAAGTSDEALDNAEGCVRFTTDFAGAELVPVTTCGFAAPDYTGGACPAPAAGPTP